MPIQSVEEAQAVARLLSEGKITGAGREAALKDLREFDAAQQQQRPDSPSPFGAAFSPERMEARREGVLEGARRVWGGIKQLGGNIRDAYGLFVEGKPYQEEGIDPGTGERKRKPLETSKGLQATANEMIRQQVQAGEDNPGKYGSVRERVADITQLVGTGVAPEALPGRAVTFTGGLARNLITGQISTAMLFDAKNNKAHDALVTGLATPLIGVLPSLGPWSMNRIGRALVEGSKRTRRSIEQAQQVLPNVDYSLAQVTGIPAMKTLEGKAYDSRLLNFYANQSDQFVSDFGRVLDLPVPGGTTMDEAFIRTQQNADAVLSKMRKTASQSWDEGMAEAARMEREILNVGRKADTGPTTFVQGGPPSTQVGAAAPRPTGRADIPVNNLRGQFAKHLQEAEDRAVRAGSAATRSRLRGLADVIGSGNKTMSASELDRTLRAIQAIRADDPAIATQLRAALDSDLDMLIDQGSMQQNKVVQQILDTRSLYRQQQAKIDILSRSAAYRLLGVPDNVQEVTSDQLLDGFRQFVPAKQAAVRKYLEENSPDLLLTMRKQTIDDAVRKARVTAPAAESEVDPAVLMDELFNPRGADMRTSGLWSDSDLAKLEKVRQGFRVIINQRPQINRAGTALTPEDLAINLVSRHAGFMARQFARALQTTKASALFTDPKLQEYLFEMSRSVTGGPTNLLARAGLMALLTEDYVGEE